MFSAFVVRDKGMLVCTSYHIMITVLVNAILNESDTIVYSRQLSCSHFFGL